MMSANPVRRELRWRVARCESGACVQVAPFRGMIVVGDTKDPHGPILAYSQDEWHEFVSRVKAGKYDNPM
jgi:uncharacterized protein DUF397